MWAIHIAARNSAVDDPLARCQATRTPRSDQTVNEVVQGGTHPGVPEVSDHRNIGYEKQSREPPPGVVGAREEHDPGDEQDQPLDPLEGYGPEHRRDPNAAPRLERVNRRSITLALSLLVILAFPVTVATATSGCQVSANPSPGWRGAQITISGTGFAPNTQISILNFNGMSVGTPTTNGSGAFSVSYTIPNDAQVGTGNIFASDGTCEHNPSYEVLAQAPTTTTIATTTTTAPTTTTTTQAETTTSLASTTTTVTAVPTTTVAGAVTTIPTDTTTTTMPDQAGGVPTWIWILVSVLALTVAVLAGVLVGRRGRGSTGG